MRRARAGATLVWVVLVGCPGTEESGQESGAVPLEPPVADAGESVAVEVGVPVELDGSASVGAQLEWNLGDGSTLPGAVVTHTYSSPGNYTASLVATGEDGTWRSDSVRVTVFEPAAAVVPVRSGSMALDRARGELWAVTPEAGAVTVVSLDGSVLAELEACEGARNVALGASSAFVSCEDADELAVFSLTSHALERRVALPVGSRPHGVVARGLTAWVGLGGTGEVATVSGEAVQVAAIGADPRALALGDTLWASRWRAGDGAGELYRLDGAGVALEDAPGPDSDTSNRGVATLLEALTLSPSGTLAVVGGVHANMDAGLFRDGTRLAHDTATRGMVRVVDVSTGEERLQVPLDDLDQAYAVAFDPLGTSFWALHPGARHLSQLDAYTGDTLRGFETGLVHATDVAVSDDGSVLYVHGWLDRVLVAFDVSSRTAPPSELWRADLLLEEPLSAEVLRGKKVFFDAYDTRMSQDAYLHCGSCHPDSRQDGRVWDFTQRGEGLRNTISLQGRSGTGHGRVHWTGNFDEIQDFENDIRGGQGGTGFLSDDTFARTQHPLGDPKAGISPELDALAAYVESLGTTPVSPHPESTLGAASFLAAGCADCHPAPLYTDSSLDSPVRHDVGTIGDGSGQRLGDPLDGFDTPTLLGSWATAPYLHDGSAPTLEAAIEAHAPGLPSSEVDLIADFVRSL